MVDIAKIFGADEVETFLGLPGRNLEEPAPGIAVLGVPLATPYEVTGDYAADAPKAIRAAMATYATARHHYDFDLGGTILPESNAANAGAEAYDYGDLVVSRSDFESNRRTITTAIKTLRGAGAVPVVIGGDDSIPIPVLAAFDELSSLHVLQFDAHIDWRHEVNGETQGLSSNMRRASEMHQVTGITQVGARGIGSARREDYEAAVAWGAHLFPMTVLDALGEDAVVSSLPTGADLFINLDIDSLDPAEMPAVIGPAPGGLSYRQVAALIAKASARCRIVGVALTEFFPERDTDGLAALTAGRLLCNAIGRIARQSVTPPA